VERDEIARKVIETTQIMADGYRNGVTQWSEQEARDKAEACATAVSNAGVFILREFGFSMDEIKDRVVSYRQP
jgi:hypothetical protein